MNLSKSLSVFDPETVASYSILMIGLGATGSQIAFNLAKMGVTNITFFDYDIVEEKNVNNQLYLNSHVGKPKTQALYEILHDINHEFMEHQFRNEKFDATTHKKLLSSKTILYLCVDEGRLNILNGLMSNSNLHYIIETRIGVDVFHVYKVDRRPKLRELYLNTVPTLERETSPTEISACGEVMSIIPAISMCAAVAAQYIRFLNSSTYMVYMETDNIGLLKEEF